MKNKIRRFSALTLLSAMMLAGCATTPVGKVTFPEPSAAFAPKETYAVTHDKLWDATLAALEKNRIATTSTDKASGIIQTDAIEAPTSLIGGGFIAVQSNRYKYNISLRNQSDSTVKLNIICKIESTLDSGSGSSQWTDYTSRNAKLAKQLELWLYEQIEKGF